MGDFTGADPAKRFTDDVVREARKIGFRGQGVQGGPLVPTAGTTAVPTGARVPQVIDSQLPATIRRPERIVDDIIDIPTKNIRNIDALIKDTPAMKALPAPSSKAGKVKKTPFKSA